MCITILEFLQSILEDTVKLEEKKTKKQKKNKKKLKEVGNTHLKKTINSIKALIIYIYKFMINPLLIVHIKKPTLPQTAESVFVSFSLEIDFLFLDNMSTCYN